MWRSFWAMGKTQRAEGQFKSEGCEWVFEVYHKDIQKWQQTMN